MGTVRYFGVRDSEVRRNSAPTSFDEGDVLTREPTKANAMSFWINTSRASGSSKNELQQAVGGEMVAKLRGRAVGGEW